MSLDMSGHIDDVFESATVTRIFEIAGYRDPNTGLWVNGTTDTSSHSATIQPATTREVDSLSQGGERLKDVRHLWINDGTTAKVIEADLWEFEGQTWRCVGLDNRQWRNYCKVTVSRLDVQP